MASIPTPNPVELPSYPGSYIPDQIPSDGPQIGPPDPTHTPGEDIPEPGEIDEGGEDPIETPEVESDLDPSLVDNDSENGTTVADAGNASGDDSNGGGDGGNSDS